MKRFSWKDYERTRAGHEAARLDESVAVPLHKLAVGDTFVIVGLESTPFVLLRLGLGSASVRRCGVKRERFEPATGKNADSEVSFDKLYDPARISLATTVCKTGSLKEEA